MRGEVMGITGQGQTGRAVSTWMCPCRIVTLYRRGTACADPGPAILEHVAVKVAPRTRAKWRHRPPTVRLR